MTSRGIANILKDGHLRYMYIQGGPKRLTTSDLLLDDIENP